MLPYDLAIYTQNGVCSQVLVHTHVYSNTSPNSQKVDVAQMSTSIWIDKGVHWIILVLFSVGLKLFKIKSWVKRKFGG
jgi:hypothetical protein